MKMFLLFLLLLTCVAFIDALIDVLMGNTWLAALYNIIHPFEVTEPGEIVFFLLLLFVAVAVPFTSYLKEKKH